MVGGEIVLYFNRHGHSRIRRIVMLAPTMLFLQKSDDNPNGVPAVVFEELCVVWKKDFQKWVDDSTGPFFIPCVSDDAMWREPADSDRSSGGGCM
jgi:non-heme chloroperoxidase